MRFCLILSLWTAALLFGCAPYSKPIAEKGSGPYDEFRINANQCFARASALAKSGNHLEAGIYFEAALRYGGKEELILPLLAAAQVRSGQLRAARKTVSRLLEIDKDQPYAQELLILLAKLTPPSEADFTEEDAQ